MISFEFDKSVPTGRVETTDLTDIDRAVGSYFRKALAELVVTDKARPENREFSDFERKDINHKLFAGQFDDPQEFVSKLVAKSPDASKERSQLFPVCYISRDPAISFTDGSDYADITHYGDIRNADGTIKAVVNKSFAKFNYSINALAWDKATIGRMGLGIAMFARHQMAFRGRHIEAKTMIAGTPTTLNLELNIPRDAIGEPISASYQENRLNGVSFSFEVIAEVLEAVFVDNQPQTLTVGDVEVLENGEHVEVSA